jgi:hypothetical protein
MQGTDDLRCLDETAEADIITWARLLGADEPTVQGWLTAPARAAVNWAACKFGLDYATAHGLAAAFFPEIGIYFTDPDRRNLARGRVADSIADVQPRIVIAHSLGSVVTYEALWAHEHPPIDLLITLGSPLAMPHIVHDRLAPHDGSRRRPPGVRRWINIADPGDIIAIPVGGISAQFADVTSDLTNAIGAFGFHRATGYLKNSVTAGILATYL